jgi:hypothetical protein
VSIAHSLKRQIDAILSGGTGPRKCLLELQRLYKKTAAVMALLPTETQLKNERRVCEKLWKVSRM